MQPCLDLKKLTKAAKATAGMLLCSGSTGSPRSLSHRRRLLTQFQPGKFEGLQWRPSFDQVYVWTWDFMSSESKSGKPLPGFCPIKEHGTTMASKAHSGT
ncbi:hypothetical protein K491DRAFT_174154 [Lophiostoma macrostomum CBS 122681]|uniref:Uncharacterized protein n=1 Tax=Lophiostoma macrostomum CBS 122681 TaxID=1314788 RepID=A0A6A6SRL9_9PLEO|nr:hypothetical protein K491DRAFT_174154 [Lophiostoma macrostomum CBS 122681]